MILPAKQPIENQMEQPVKSHLVLQERPLVVQTGLKDLFGEHEAELLQHIIYCREAPFYDKLLRREITLAEHQGRVYVHIPTRLMFDVWTGQLRHFSLSTFRRAVARCKAQGVLVSEDRLDEDEQNDNTNWYAVVHEVFDPLTGIYEEYWTRIQQDRQNALVNRNRPPSEEQEEELKRQMWEQIKAKRQELHQIGLIPVLNMLESDGELPKSRAKGTQPKGLKPAPGLKPAQALKPSKKGVNQSPCQNDTMTDSNPQRSQSTVSERHYPPSQSDTMYECQSDTIDSVNMNPCTTSTRISRDILETTTDNPAAPVPAAVEKSSDFLGASLSSQTLPDGVTHATPLTPTFPQPPARPAPDQRAPDQAAPAEPGLTHIAQITAMPQAAVVPQVAATPQIGAAPAQEPPLPGVMVAAPGSHPLPAVALDFVGRLVKLEPTLITPEIAGRLIAERADLHEAVSWTAAQVSERLQGYGIAANSDMMREIKNTAFAEAQWQLVFFHLRDESNGQFCATYNEQNKDAIKRGRKKKLAPSGALIKRIRDGEVPPGEWTDEILATVRRQVQEAQDRARKEARARERQSLAATYLARLTAMQLKALHREVEGRLHNQHPGLAFEPSSPEYQAEEITALNDIRVRNYLDDLATAEQGTVTKPVLTVDSVRAKTANFDFYMDRLLRELKRGELQLEDLRRVIAERVVALGTKEDIEIFHTELLRLYREQAAQAA